jgi:cell division protein FtsZ
MTLDEARMVVETISAKLDDEARVIWGAQINDDMADTIRAMLIVTGVKSSQIFGKSKKAGESKKEEMVTELGIEFVD